MDLLIYADLYRHDEDGKRQTDEPPIARITVNADEGFAPTVSIHMQDNSVLFSTTLENLGYILLWP